MNIIANKCGYALEMIDGHTMATFPDLMSAILVKKYIEGFPLSEEESEKAKAAITEYDRQCKQRHDEYAAKKAIAKEKAAARRKTKAAAQSKL